MMSDEVILELENVREELRELRLRVPSVRELTVTAVDAATKTFTVAVPGARDLPGLFGGEHFLPAVDDDVVVELQGNTPVLRPQRIAEGAVGERELAGYVTENITIAMDAANGKNKFWYSPNAPTTEVGTAVGDPWMRRDNTSRVITGSWEWDGDSWEPVTYGDQVLASLTVGKLVGGNGTFDLIVGGRIATANTGQRSELNPLGFQAFNASGVLTVHIDGVTNLLTGELRTGQANTRRVIVGGAGHESSIRLLAPNGATSYLRSSNESGIGGEGLQLGLTIAGAPAYWNSIVYNQAEWASYHSKIHDFAYQDRWSIIQTTNRAMGVTDYRILLDVNALQIRGGNLGAIDRWWTFNLFTGAVEHRLASGAKTTFTDGGATESPKMSMIAPDGWGAILKFVTSGGYAFEVRNIFDNGFLPVRASAFDINSDARGKHDIRDAPVADALALLDQVKGRVFRRKHSGDRPVLNDSGVMVAVIEEDGPEEIGVLAQEMPEFVHSGGEDGSELNISVLRWLLLLTAAVQELNKKGGPKK